MFAYRISDPDPAEELLLPLMSLTLPSDGHDTTTTAITLLPGCEEPRNLRPLPQWLSQ
jgi:hypothetical protein